MVSPNNRTVQCRTVCWRQRQGQLLFKKDYQLWYGSVYSAPNDDGLCLHWPQEAQHRPEGVADIVQVTLNVCNVVVAVVIY